MSGPLLHLYRYKPEIDVWFAGPKMPVPTGSYSWYLRGMEYNNALVVMASYRVPVETQRSPYEQQQDEVVSSKVGCVLDMWATVALCNGSTAPVRSTTVRLGAASAAACCCGAAQQKWDVVGTTLSWQHNLVLAAPRS